MKVAPRTRYRIVQQHPLGHEEAFIIQVRHRLFWWWRWMTLEVRSIDWRYAGTPIAFSDLGSAQRYLASHQQEMASTRFSEPAVVWEN